MSEKKKVWVYSRIDAPEDQYGSLKLNMHYAWAGR